MFRFIIDGDPVGKGRPRVTRRGITYTPAKTKHYEAWVVASYSQALREQGQRQEDVFIEKGKKIGIVINALYPIPKSYSKKRINSIVMGNEHPTKKPDLDNIIKIILDALNGVAFHDDAQIVELRASKGYAMEKDEEGKVIVTIEEV